MQQLIRQSAPYRGSYLLGFLRNVFPAVSVFDVYGLTSFKKIPANCIVYVDDEVIIDNTVVDIEKIFSPNENNIFILKIPSVYERFKKLGLRCVLFPWWHIVDDSIALNLLDQRFELYYPSDRTLSFDCFNRRFTPDRNSLIDYLISKNLINQGWVTGWEYKQPGLRPNDLEHYIANGFGFERHNHKIEGVAISSNVLNFIKINHQHRQLINISVETRLTDFFPTEKSFLAFFTKKIPIVLAQPNRINDLRSQGFDTFDDIVNHGHDSLSDATQKIVHSINANLSILQSTFPIDRNLRDRLDYNWNHLMYKWLYVKLNELQNLLQ